MGDPPTSGASPNTWEAMKAYLAAYPRFMQEANSQVGPAAQAQLAADTAVAPGYAALQNQVYGQYGPEAARVGSQITGQNERMQAENDLATLNGPGRDVVTGANNLARIADPEFYSTREAGANHLADLFKSMDLSPGLSESERREVGSSLARDNNSRGLSETPTATSTIENAIQFGQAGANRMAQKQDSFGKALGQLTSFLPSSRSGVDTFAQATRGAGMPNPSNMFTQPAIQGAGQQQAFGSGSNIFNQASNLQGISMQANANRTGALEKLPNY